MLADLPRVAGGIDLGILFSDETYPTTSFMDELIRQTLVVGLASQLHLLGADEFAQELATLAAERYGVTDRLSFE